MSEDEKPSLQRQVTAVELAYRNRSGYIDVLRANANSGRSRRSPEELRLAELTLPDLRQAWLTMQFVEANADKIRAATKAPDPDDPF